MFKNLEYGEANAFYRIEKDCAGAEIWLVKVGHYAQKVPENGSKSAKNREKGIFSKFQELFSFRHLSHFLSYLAHN